MEVSQLVKSLQQLTEEYKALIHPIRHEDSATSRQLKQKILGIQRDIGLLEGREVAIPCDWPAPWGFRRQTFPVMLSNGLVTMLIYNSRPDALHEETIAHSGTRRANHQNSSVALVTFQNCESAKLGTPNEEVIEGHPLYGYGIDVGGAYVVSNSRWVEELQRINMVHSQFNAAYWAKLQHYLLFFKERTFECVAGAVFAERHNAEVTDVIAIAADRLFIPKQ